MTPTIIVKLGMLFYIINNTFIKKYLKKKIILCGFENVNDL